MVKNRIWWITYIWLEKIKVSHNNRNNNEKIKPNNQNLKKKKMYRLRRRKQTVGILWLNLWSWRWVVEVDTCTWTKKIVVTTIEKIVAPRNLLNKIPNGTFLRFCINPFGEYAMPLISPKLIIFLPTPK